jgi:multidrug efflux system outer membrane protein
MAARRRAIALLAAVSAGCTLGPDYKRPPVTVAEAWRELPVAEAESLANTPWWELFGDPVLQDLVRIALVENKDLKIAVERIEEARAFYGFTKSEFYPQLDASASAGVFEPTEDVVSQAGTSDSTQLYQVGVGVTWEIDFFGRIRRATEAQRALLLATEEARRSVVLGLVSDVARAYVELRDLDWRLEIGRRTLESRREYVQLARDRFEGGITPELDLRQAEAEFFRTEALVSDFERLVMQKENELSVLLGRNPGAIPRGSEARQVPVPPAVPAGLPSELLERRPDLRQVEHELHAQTANIGAAKALLYPRIALTGSYGWATTDIENVFDAPARAWSLAANLLQPIFNAGRNRRRVEITESQQRQALYAYERAILQAFREVEDTLVGYRKAGEQRVSQASRVGAERKVLELAEARYRGGVANYLEVLDAQRSLFNAELDEVQAVSSHLVALIRLYKALGGGWPAEASAPQAAGAVPGA